MMNLDRIDSRVCEVLGKLRTEKYVLADTRVPDVSLYDHVYLTAGIASAMVAELLRRGLAPRDISAEDISVDELRSIVRISSLLHDWGKHHPSAYRDHVTRSIEWTNALLEEEGVEEPHKSLIVSAVKRHHLEYGPQTHLEKVVCLSDSYASAADRPELSKAETPEELLKVSSSTLGVEESLFGSTKGIVLLLGDVDRIKAYVFETTRLPEIRGGSEILNELNNGELEALFKQRGLGSENLIYNGGGSFLAVVPTSLVDDLSDDIRRMYLEKTTNVTITVVKSPPLGFLEFGRGLKPYTIRGEGGLMAIEGKGVGNWLLSSHFGDKKEEWPQRKGFGELVSSLASELRMEKGMKNYVPFFETLPITRRCQSCGTRGATSYDDNRKEYLCSPCEIKRKRGRNARYEFLRRFESWLKDEQKLTCMFKPPPYFDLDDLSKQYDGYVAFIYADGNDIGSLLYKARTPAAYRHISETLAEATGNALFEGLFQAVGRERLAGQSGSPPFEIINIGGDDITVITAGPLAWRFSIEFLKSFEVGVAELGEELDSCITCSLGFVIAKSTYPVYYMEKLAESLLRSAKRVAKEAKEPVSSLSYLYLTSPIATDNAEELIGEYYRSKRGSAIITMRPYPLSQADTIWKISAGLKKLLSTSQAHAWEQALQKGPLFAANYLLYQIGRMPLDKKQRLLDLLNDMSNIFNLRMHERLFGLDSKGQVSTPLMDVLEVIKFSGGELDGSS